MRVKCKCGNNRFFFEKRTLKYKVKSNGKEVEIKDTESTLVCTKCKKINEKWTE